MELAVLDRPLYTIAEAARLLEIPPATLRRWLEGVTVRGKRYPPVIRPESTGEVEVTWAEFVEAGYLREYRQTLHVTLHKLRPFIDAMREAEGVSYPLAHFEPVVDTDGLLLYLDQLERMAPLPEPLRPLVRTASGQLVLGEPMRAFLQKVTFDAHGIARQMRPLGAASPVVIDPEQSFGVPQIRGIRTELIAEALATGDTPSDVMRDYVLTGDEVTAAIQWELRVARTNRAA